VDGDRGRQLVGQVIQLAPAADRHQDAGGTFLLEARLDSFRIAGQKDKRRSESSLPNGYTEGFGPDSISPVFRFGGIATPLKQLSDQGGPTGLMAGSEALPGVAVKILVEKDEIAPV
jgi:hypothetical protein